MEAIRIGRVGIGLLARLYFEIGEKLGELRKRCNRRRRGLLNLEARFNDTLYI